MRRHCAQCCLTHRTALGERGSWSRPALTNTTAAVSLPPTPTHPSLSFSLSISSYALIYFHLSLSTTYLLNLPSSYSHFQTLISFRPSSPKSIPSIHTPTSYTFSLLLPLPPLLLLISFDLSVSCYISPSFPHSGSPSLSKPSPFYLSFTSSLLARLESKIAPLEHHHLFGPYRKKGQQLLLLSCGS